MNSVIDQITRRHFFGRTAMGLGSAALASLVGREAGAAIGEREALISQIVCLTHRAIRPHLEGEAGENQIRDPPPSQYRVEVGATEPADVRARDGEVRRIERDARR